VFGCKCPESDLRGAPKVGCNALVGTATPLSLAVIGCGRVAELCHVPALQTLADVQLVALVDRDLDRLNTLADQLGVLRRYDDYRAVLHDTRIDIVAICTPPQCHAEIGLAVLDAGKHLFMEKPLALCLDDADRLVDRAAASHCKAFVGFNFRWHPLVRRARRIIDQGGLGQIETMHTVFTSRTAFAPQASEWRNRADLGGGVLLDLGIHHFDLWRFLTQSEVDEVVTYQHTDDAGIECATVSAVMGNGTLVTGSFTHGLSDTNEVEICGRKGRLRFSCYRHGSLRVSENCAPQGALGDRLSKVIHALRSVSHAVSQWRQGGGVIASYRGEWQHFVDAIKDASPVGSSFADGRSALQVALATVESAVCQEPIRVAHAARSITPVSAATRGLG